MDLVTLNDGQVEIIGSHRDIVDIVRDKCGDDLAKMVEQCDPDGYESAYNAHSQLFLATEVLEDRKSDGSIKKCNVEIIQRYIERAMSILSDIIQKGI